VWINRDKPQKHNGTMKKTLLPLLVCAAFALTGCNPDSFVGSQSDEAAVFVDGGSGHNVDGGSGHNADGGSGHNADGGSGHNADGGSGHN